MRERVVIVGFRSDLGVEWSFPKPTHSKDELLFQQWVSGEYWDHHRVLRKRRIERPDKIRDRVLKLSDLGLHVGKPWRTVRDAFADLPPPREGKIAVPNHQYQPGARTYPGHTGSAFDWPAKTLKAGVHGVPGGENMLVLSDGSVRYFSVREAARLQAFPDDYVFPGAWGENMRQLGNAVPVHLGETVARRVRSKLSRAEVRPGA
jgi:DNA (cytosine-5)-methyltransferase 1